jgi:hypothetical protein
MVTDSYGEKGHGQFVLTRALILRVKPSFIKPHGTVFVLAGLVRQQQTRILCAHENQRTSSRSQLSGSNVAFSMRRKRKPYFGSRPGFGGVRGRREFHPGRACRWPGAN